MEMLIGIYIIICLLVLLTYMGNAADEVLQSRVITLNQLLMSILFFPATIVTLLCVVAMIITYFIIDILKKIHFKNVVVFNFNKKKK